MVVVEPGGRGKSEPALHSELADDVGTHMGRDLFGHDAGTL